MSREDYETLWFYETLNVPVFLPVAVSKCETQSSKKTFGESEYVEDLKISSEMFYLRNCIRRYPNVTTCLWKWRLTGGRFLTNLQDTPIQFLWLQPLRQDVDS